MSPSSRKSGFARDVGTWVESAFIAHSLPGDETLCRIRRPSRSMGRAMGVALVVLDARPARDVVRWPTLPPLPVRVRGAMV